MWTTSGLVDVEIMTDLRRLEGQLSVLPNFTNPSIIFHIINEFNLNVKTIFKSTSFHNLLQHRLLHIKSTLNLEKNKLNNNYNVKRNNKHIDNIKLEYIKYQNTNLNKNATK